MIPNIKIAVNGQVERDTRTAFTYPETYNPEDTGSGAMWLRALFDPRDARNFDCSKLYAFWNGPQGNYYGMIVPSPSDTRNGRLMITLFVGRNYIRDGKYLETVFNRLEKMLVNNPVSPQTEGIAEFVNGIVLTPAIGSARAGNIGSVAYRRYDNSTVLSKILGNCDQKYYTRFKRVFFVPSIAISPAESAGLTEIKIPVEVSYYFRNIPADIKPDRLAVRKGESVRLTFDKDGFTSETIEVKVDGTPNDYFSYQGYELVFNRIEPDTIEFKRKITLRAKDRYGTPVTTLRIQPLGNVCRMIDNRTIEFSNPAESYDIVLSTDDGRSVNVHISARDLKTGQKEVTFPGGVEPRNYKAAAQRTDKGLSAGKAVAVVFGLLTAVYLLYAAVCGIAEGVVWPFNGSEQVTAKQPAAPADSVKQEKKTPSAENLETVDVEYMKNNNRWEIAQLGSPKYSRLATCLANGDVDSIIGQEWFAADKENGYWRQIVSTLNTLTAEQKNAAKAKLVELCADGIIDTPAILNALGNISVPAAVDNPEPRIEKQRKVIRKRPAPTPKNNTNSTGKKSNNQSGRTPVL